MTEGLGFSEPSGDQPDDNKFQTFRYVTEAEFWAAGSVGFAGFLGPLIIGSVGSGMAINEYGSKLDAAYNGLEQAKEPKRIITKYHAQVSHETAQAIDSRIVKSESRLKALQAQSAPKSHDVALLEQGAALGGIGALLAAGLTIAVRGAVYRHKVNKIVRKAIADMEFQLEYNPKLK
jgi:hypothetical protein